MVIRAVYILRTPEGFANFKMVLRTVRVSPKIELW